MSQHTTCKTCGDWVSKYDDEHRCAAPAAGTGQAEELVRYCPECGHIGDVGTEHRDCCPDGSHARRVPKKFAEMCQATFRMAIAPQAATGAQGLTVEQTATIRELLQCFLAWDKDVRVLGNVRAEDAADAMRAALAASRKGEV